MAREKGKHGGSRENAGRKPLPTTELIISVREMAGAHGENAMAKLAALMDSVSEPIRLRAVELMLAYAYGKPRQSVDVGVEQPMQSINIEFVEPDGETRHVDVVAEQSA